MSRVKRHIVIYMEVTGANRYSVRETVLIIGNWITAIETGSNPRNRSVIALAPIFPSVSLPTVHLT
ncbi:hypothetical protein J6590_050265 [Homalodisca vitripennis]|nr:hypothetical protein J6590_050265 [Homalodisca vitripennis]